MTNPINAAYDKKLALKNNAPCFSCVLRINNTPIDDFQDLDTVMSLLNLLRYSKNYQKTSKSLFNYSQNQSNSGAENGFNYSIKDSKFKTSSIGKLGGNNTELQNIKITIPLKYLSKFVRILDNSLINCEVSLDLKWRKNCVLTSQVTRPAGADPVAN